MIQKTFEEITKSDIGFLVQNKIEQLYPILMRGVVEELHS